MRGLSRHVAQVALVIVLALVASIAVGPAARAEDGYSYGTTSAPVTLKLSTGIKWQWWQCSVVGRWKVAAAQQYLTVSGGCTRGWAALDKDGWFYADVPDCGKAFGYIGNLDEKDEVGSFQDIALTPRGQITTGTSCGAPTQLCMTDLDPSVADDSRYQPGANSAAQRTQCVAWNPGSPPTAQPSWYSSGVGDCPRGRVLEPWVTAPHPVDLGGGTWRWESEGVLRVDQQTDPNVGLPTWGTAGLYLGAYVMLAGGSGTTQVVVTNGGGSQWGGASFAGVGGGMLMDNQSAVPTKTARVKMEWVVRGPTLTTALGSGVPSFAYRGIGTYPTPVYNIGVNSSRLPYANTAAVTSSVYQSAGADASSYAGRTDGLHCYTVWGTASTGVPTGAITYQATATPPAPSTGTTSPPVIEVDVDNDGCAAGSICVNPSDGIDPDDVAPPSIPDPDSDSCNFSITSPSTWGGQLICALVSVAKGIIGAIADVIQAIVGLIGDLLDGLLDLLTALFVPDGTALQNALDSLRDALTESRLGEWTSPLNGAFDAPGSGGCEGPTVDLSTLGVPGVEEMKPFDACSGPAADAAGTVRLVMTVTIGLGAGMFIARMVTSALGIRVPAPGTDGGERR